MFSFPAVPLTIVVFFLLVWDFPGSYYDESFFYFLLKPQHCGYCTIQLWILFKLSVSWFSFSLQYGKRKMLLHLPLLPMEVEVQVPHLASVDTPGVGLPVTPRQRCEFLFPLDLHWCIPAREGQEYLCKHRGVESSGWPPYCCVKVEVLTLWLPLTFPRGGPTPLCTLDPLALWRGGFLTASWGVKALSSSLASSDALPWGQEKLTGEVSAHLCCHCGSGASFSGVFGVEWLLPKILLSC